MPSRFLRLLPSLVTMALALICAAPLGSAEKGKSGITIDWGKINPPDRIDPKYTPEALLQAFNALCRQLGYRVQRVAVDQSEFPFLVYGVLEGRCDYRDIRDALMSMPGYAYTGSVTHASDGATSFALNMIPMAAYYRRQNDPTAARAFAEHTFERLEKLGGNQR